MKTRLLINAIILFLSIILGPFVNGDTSQNLNILGTEDFNTIETAKLPGGWWAEGGQKIGVEKGYLRIKADPLVGFGKWCTVWTDIIVSGDVQITYDAHVFSSRGNHNNINFFLFYVDPSGKPLDETRAARISAEYSLYHKLEGYIVTFVNKKEHARIRIRRCPGFKLLKEGKGYHCRKGAYISHHHHQDRPKNNL